MKLTKINFSGLHYLTAVTQLLQNIRLENASAGLYEAADLQWWWREDAAALPERQIFWHNENGTAVACLLRLKTENEWYNDFFFLPSSETAVKEEIHAEVISIIYSTSHRSTVTVRDNDLFFRRLLEGAGFIESSLATVQTQLWGDPPQVPLKNGFQLCSREQDAGHPHHMTYRGGANIEKKLKECSLYRPDLDLVIRDIKGNVAAYGLFWMDPVTKVGLIEPMRTETPFQRLGLARYLLAEGIHRLRALGAGDIKVSYKTNNEAAMRLYHQCGFRDQFVKLEYQLADKGLQLSSSD